MAAPAESMCQALWGGGGLGSAPRRSVDRSRGGCRRAQCPAVNLRGIACYGGTVTPRRMALFLCLASVLTAPVAWSQPQASPPTTAWPTFAVPPQLPATAPSPTPSTVPSAGLTPAPAPSSPAPEALPRRRPSLLRERLRLLDAGIVPIADRSRDARITDGVIQLAVGAAFVTLGLVLPSDTPGIDTYQYLSFFQGGYAVAGGLTQLLWTPARERLSRAYAAMPRSTPAERRARVRFGEESLEEMAADGRRRRILVPLVSSLVQLGTLGILYREQIFNGAPMPEPSAINYLMIGLTGVTVATTLLGMLSTSPEEQLRDRYRSEVEMLRQYHETPAE